MNFSAPWALLLLLFIPYFVWLGRSMAPRPVWRRWLSLGIRLLIILLLTLALAGTQMIRAADELAVVFLVDASDSMSREQKESAEALIQQAMATMGADDQAAVILFGADALVDRPMSGLAELAPVSTVPQTIQTDLAEALRLGMALFPPGTARRIVVLSDGAINSGDTELAARVAAAADIEIDYITLAADSLSGEAWLVDVDAPTQVREGERFGVVVSAESTVNQSARLRILAGGAIVYEADVTLRNGINNFTLQLQATEQEFSRYTVELLPVHDTYPQNNRLAAFTEVVGAPRVLLVTHDGTLNDKGNPRSPEATQLTQALTATGLKVDVVTPLDLPSSLAELSNYASVVLVDVNAKSLADRKMEALQSYVRDLGCGLVVVGGAESYGMGGYFRTALEETLPVDMQIKDSERFPDVSIVIVIDRSGSMGAQEGGLTKIQLAAEGAVRVVQLLNGNDQITVIPVDTQPDQIIGPAYASDGQQLIDQIRSIGAGGGGIYVRTGIEAAINVLNESSHEVKHIIVLADGGDSEEKNGVPQLLNAFVDQGGTVTFVAIGDGPDVPWLQDMAERGNGRFHFTNRAGNLPEIFTQETTNIQRSYLVEERFFPVLVRNSPILNNITSVPALQGYVGTQAKGTAQVVLETHQGDPLLAQWQYGLGRAVAWTSDATGRWGRDWVAWEGFPVFWAQTVRWTISQSRDNAVETAVTFTQGAAALSVDVRDGEGGLRDNLTLEANVVDPDGNVTAITLQQTAPGHYSADFTPQKEGAYFIRIAGSGEDAAAVGQTTGWVLGYSPEYQQFEENGAVLASLAAETGGRDLSGDVAAAFAHTLQAGRTIRPIWHVLLLAALLLFPLDIAVRRLVISRRDWARLYAWSIGRLLPQRAAPEPMEQPQRVSRLFEAKKRAAVTTSDTANPISSEATPAKPATPPSVPKAVASKPASKPSIPTSDSGAALSGYSLASRLRKRRKS